MSGAYLPVTQEVRDRANDYLRGIDFWGMGLTFPEAIRLASQAQRDQEMEE